MIITERYLPILAAQVGDILVPFWMLTSKKVESYGSEILQYFYEGKEVRLSQEVAWDTKKSKIAPSIIVNAYLKEEGRPFDLGSKFLVDKGYVEGGFTLKKMSISTLEDIKYEEYDVHFMSGKKMKVNGYDKWYNDVTIDDNVLYEMRTWKPIYCFSDGSSTQWTHELALLEE